MRSTWPKNFGGSMLLIFLVFVLSYCESLRSEFHVVMSVTISAWKQCLVRLCLQLFVGSSCLIYVICVCLCVMVSNTFCVVFFFILCSLCCQFLWIVHLWLLLPYSLTCIYIIQWKDIISLVEYEIKGSC